MTMLSSATYNLINLLLKFLIFSKSSPSLMYSVTRKLRNNKKLDLEYFLIAKKKRTLINTAFVLPMLLTRHNERVMTNCFLY